MARNDGEALGVSYDALGQRAARLENLSAKILSSAVGASAVELAPQVFTKDAEDLTPSRQNFLEANIAAADTLHKLIDKSADVVYAFSWHLKRASALYQAVDNLPQDGNSAPGGGAS